MGQDRLGPSTESSTNKQHHIWDLVMQEYSTLCSNSQFPSCAPHPITQYSYLDPPVRRMAFRSTTTGLTRERQKRDTEDPCEDAPVQPSIYLYIYVYILVRGWGSTPQLFGVVGTLPCFFSLYLWTSRCNLVGFKPILQRLRPEGIGRYPDYAERAHAVLSREGGPTSRS